MEKVKIFFSRGLQHKIGNRKGYELLPDIYFAVFKTLFHCKYVGWYFLLMSVLNTVHIIFEAIIFYKMKLPYLEMLKFGFTPCFHIYGGLNILTMVNLREPTLETIESIKRIQWPIKNLSEKTKKDIKVHVFITRITFYLYCLGICIYMCITNDEIYNTLVIQYAVERGWRGLEKILISFLIISKLSLCVCVTFLPYAVIYLISEWRVQIALFNDFVQVSARRREILRNQTSVARLLKKIAHRHIQLMQEYIRVQPLCSRASFKVIVANMFFSPFLIFSTMKGFLTREVLVLHLLSFQVVYSYATFVGQGYENKWRTFHKVLCEMPWYSFNTTNRKTYSIMLSGSSDPVQFIVWNSLALNNELYMEVWKILYTTVNALYKLRGKYARD